MKTTSIKRVNITLPERTLRAIDRVAQRGDRSGFIDRAVNYYVDEMGKKNLRAQLEEGARERSSRDADVSAEWFGVDESTWQKSRS